MNANSVKSKYWTNQNANQTCPINALQKCRVRNIESISELAGSVKSNCRKLSKVEKRAWREERAWRECNSVKSKYWTNQNANWTCPTNTLLKCRVRNIELNSELSGWYENDVMLPFIFGNFGCFWHLSCFILWVCGSARSFCVFTDEWHLIVQYIYIMLFIFVQMCICGQPSSPRTKQLIVTWKVRGSRTLGSKNLCGTAPPMLNMLLTL